VGDERDSDIGFRCSKLTARHPMSVLVSEHPA
jgi:hypothetical protein